MESHLPSAVQQGSDLLGNGPYLPQTVGPLACYLEPKEAYKDTEAFSG